MKWAQGCGECVLSRRIQKRLLNRAFILWPHHLRRLARAPKLVLRLSPADLWCSGVLVFDDRHYFNRLVHDPIIDRVMAADAAAKAGADVLNISVEQRIFTQPEKCSISAS